MRRLDLVGQTIGELTVIRFSRVIKRHTAWICTCKCNGKEIEVLSPELRRGRKKSCGCLRGRRAHGPPRLILADKRFGRLTVLNFTGMSTDRRSMWLCRCDCGRQKICVGKELVSGHVQSCGCLSGQIRSFLNTGRVAPTRKPAGVASFNWIVRSYITNAKKAERVWALTLDAAIAILKQDCWYCGAAPRARSPSGKRALAGKYKLHGPVIAYNGIDRVDDKMGYTPDNVVPCCKICNIAKRDLTLSEFMRWLARAYHHSLRRVGLPPPTLPPKIIDESVLARS